jgi:hypothetical protein
MAMETAGEIEAEAAIKKRGRKPRVAAEAEKLREDAELGHNLHYQGMSSSWRHLYMAISQRIKGSS